MTTIQAQEIIEALNLLNAYMEHFNAQLPALFGILLAVIWSVSWIRR